MIFADVASTLSSGGVQAILATGLIVFAGVILYQNKKIEFLYKEKDSLQEKRLQDKVDTTNKYNEAMGAFSQTASLLYDKLKSGG